MSMEYLNSSTFTQIKELGDLLDIPVVSESQQVWFIRTSGGDYYDDFRLNSYVAIGWDKIPVEWVLRKPLLTRIDDGSIGDETKMPLFLSEQEFKNRVIDIYPEEKRPGLIYGQLNTFYNVMQVGDWVVIPSKSTQELKIGILGDIFQEEIHDRKPFVENEYIICTYTHKRIVSWKKVLPASYDIYLQKSIRAQQTISNITDISTLIFRHLYPVYIVNNEVRVTFQKTTESELNVLRNMELIDSVIRIADEVADLYKVKPFIKDFTMKTAVGSPGIIELIVPMINSLVPIVWGTIMMRLISGKYDSVKGLSTGLSNIFNMVNKHLNDKKERELKDAEIRNVDADTQVKMAEAEKICAEAEKIKTETELLKKSVENSEYRLKTGSDGQMMFDITPTFSIEEMSEPSEGEVKAHIVPIATNCKKCVEAAKANGF